jgi:hypothetical protein
MRIVFTQVKNDEVKDLESSIHDLKYIVGGLQILEGDHWTDPLSSLKAVTDFEATSAQSLILTFDLTVAPKILFFIRDDGKFVAVKVDSKYAGAIIEQNGFKLKLLPAKGTQQEVEVYSWPAGDPLCGGG